MSPKPSGGGGGGGGGAGRTVVGSQSAPTPDVTPGVAPRSIVAAAGGPPAAALRDAADDNLPRPLTKAAVSNSRSPLDPKTRAKSPDPIAQCAAACQEAARLSREASPLKRPGARPASPICDDMAA
eukprot:337604-Prymnesium_polylepis.1